jgi:phage-related protein
MTFIDLLDRDDSQRDWSDAPERPLTQQKAASAACLLTRPRYQRDVEAVCRRGSVAVAQMVAELGLRHGTVDEVQRAVSRHAKRLS